MIKSDSEDHEHDGMIQTYYQILPPSFNTTPQTSDVDQFDSLPHTTKVPAKPTNRCRRPKCSKYCHLHPICKSKDKTKGAQKIIRSSYYSIADSNPRFMASDGLLVNEMLNTNVDKLKQDDYMDYDGVDEGSTNEIKNGKKDDDNDSMSSCDLGMWWDLVEGMRSDDNVIVID